MPDDLQSRQLFEQCIDEHADSLYRVAYRLTGNRELAEELIQETYLNAWKSISTLHDQAKIRGWMFAILRNQYGKMIRRRPSIQQTADMDTVSQLTDPPQPAAVFDQQEWVQAAMEKLAEDQRLPLLLVTMEGLTVDEAAEVLQIPRGTVLSRLHRGRQKLKQLLALETGPSETSNANPNVDSQP